MVKVIDFTLEEEMLEYVYGYGHSTPLGKTLKLIITQSWEHENRVFHKQILVYQGQGAYPDRALDDLCRNIEMERAIPQVEYHNYYPDGDEDYENIDLVIQTNGMPEDMMKKLKDAFLKSNSSKLPAH